MTLLSEGSLASTTLPCRRCVTPPLSSQARELQLYLSKTEAWAKKLQPGLHFERFIERVEKLSAGRRTALHVREVPPPSSPLLI